METNNNYNGLEIAIIGMSAKFPESPDINTYWQNLKSAKDMIKKFNDEELIKSGVSQETLNDKNFMRSFGILAEKNQFDNHFFGYTSQEASFMDPQTRIFHEQCWKALEDSGYSSLRDKYRIGLFAGAADNINWKTHVFASKHKSELDPFYIDIISNEKNMCTMISHKLNLTGPSLYISTACSTSLVAVNTACKSLLTRECNIALAGGISIITQLKKGYHYKEGMILSKDGYCRAFDKNASGTIIGEGAGVIVLKRLSEAIKDNDNIYAIIKSSSVNNDGTTKVGYTAPSVNGQSDCIRMAHRIAGIDINTIGYIETHGTGTILGDPIEIRALNNAYKGSNLEKESCAIGSVKASIGHLDAAAGIAGLIKAVLSVKNKAIPASLNFVSANPEIEFENGPFYVNTELKEWKTTNGTPRRAGVSSFGIGGTNAHVIIEEFSSTINNNVNEGFNILPLSAKSKESLYRYSDILRNYLLENDKINVSDLAYTFQVGKTHFEQRKCVVFEDKKELINLLKVNDVDKRKVVAHNYNNSIIFMFPGQGSQYVNMGKDLYATNENFRIEMDKGFFIIEKHLNIDIKKIIFSDQESDLQINQTRFTQPLLFIIEYSLAKLIMSFGITPKYMIGHSLGEYVAACISGVFSYEDALELLIKRAKLMSELPKGSMLTAHIGEKEADRFITNKISLASVNSVSQVVFSGDEDSIMLLADTLNSLNIANVKLHTSHAFHSYMLDSILLDYKKELEKIGCKKAQLPFLSNLTGEVILKDETIPVDYWVSHMRQTVLFSKGIKTIFHLEKNPFFIEIGPGKILTNLLKQNSENSKAACVNLVQASGRKMNDARFFAENLAQLWLNGINIDWNIYNLNRSKNRISSPTYSFEPTKYITEVDPLKSILSTIGTDFNRQNSDNWFYKVIWKQAVNFSTSNYNDKNILVFLNEIHDSKSIIDYFSLLSSNCFFVLPGSQFVSRSRNSFEVDICNENSYLYLFEYFKSNDIVLDNLIHLWTFDEPLNSQSNLSANLNFYKQIGYDSLLYVVKAFTSIFNSSSLKIDIISNGLFKVLGDEIMNAAKTTLLGAAKVIPKEFGNIICKVYDVLEFNEESLKLIFGNDVNCLYNDEIAIRGKNKFSKEYEKLKFESKKKSDGIKNASTYLISGANGGMAKIFAKYLAKEYHSNLILIARKDIDQDFLDILNEFGSKVIHVKSDMSNVFLLENDIRNAENVLGEIKGVIHTAGIADFSGVILNRNPKDDNKIFMPKVFGTHILYSIFENCSLDFFVNCSALAASIAPFGQAAYVASNIYQDNFSESVKSKYPVLSIEWTSLKEVGMAYDSTRHLGLSVQNKLLETGINSSELIDVFTRVLCFESSVLIISTTEINYVLHSTFNPLAELEIQSDAFTTNFSEKPILSDNYELPVTEVEIKLTQLLESFFGFKNISVNDDFFELGGDSLKAMIVLRKIKTEFGLDIALKDFFEYRNIKQIAEHIDEKLWVGKKSIKKFGSII